ncbi:MAG: TRAP transporter small permease subunit, partial [Alphaproteobacteria bacterium]|nr:TRAP transporter small permease subunit [Alphaproteobacteria bacterium]
MPNRTAVANSRFWNPAKSESVASDRGAGREDNTDMQGRTAWRILVKVNDLVYKVLTFLCAVFLAAVVVTVFYQVVGRYVLQVSTPWSEETAVYSFIWMVLFGSALGVRDHSHLVADVLPETMGPLFDKLIPTLTYAVVFVLALAFVR